MPEGITRQNVQQTLLPLFAALERVGVFRPRQPIRLPDTGGGEPTPTPGSGERPKPGGGGSSSSGGGFSDDPNAGKPGYDAYGKQIPESKLPPGWVVNPNTGELLPPDSGGATGGTGGIGIGELFAAGDTVYRWNGKSITKATVAETRAFFNGDTGSSEGSDDPLSEARFGEAVRAQRIQEAQAALDSIAQRAQLAQEARLEGMRWALPPGSQYFPNIGPTSPAVRAGLIEPMRPAMTPFDPERIARETSDQARIEQELARIRGAAGY